MSAIEATSGTYRSRVDGTIVLSVEIEPAHRAAALALFGLPGTPLALAALKPASSKPEPEERPFRGELCRWTAIRCGEPAFAAWLETERPDLWQLQLGRLGDAVEAAAECVRVICGVESRTELDTNEKAATLLHAYVRKPYSQWLKKGNGA